MAIELGTPNIEKGIKGKIDEIIISKVIHELPSLTRAVPIAFPDKFSELFKEKMRDKEGKVTLTLVVSHTSHLDGIPLAALTKKLIDMSNLLLGPNILKGLKIPIASSMKTGDQGSVVKEGTTRMHDVMSKQYYLEALHYTREKDKKDYGLKGNNNLGAMLRITRGVKKGYGVALFPEGTMQGGRIEDYGLFRGNRFGLQEFKEIDDMAEIIRRAGREPLFLPVGIDGGFRLESPDNNRLTAAYLTEIFLTHPDTTKLVSVKAGTPIFQEEIGSENINEFFGKKVAQLLPEQARGVYA